MNLMIDLETLSTAPTAAFQQIGYAYFNDHEVLNTGVYYVDPQSCIDRGLTVDWPTIQWWLVQSQETRETFALGGMPLHEALLALVNFTIYIQAQHGLLKSVWSHGASFDIPILENAFLVCGIIKPWSYKQIRDTRTLFEIHPADEKVESLHPHNAMWDAVAQAEQVIKCLNQ